MKCLRRPPCDARIRTQQKRFKQLIIHVWMGGKTVEDSAMPCIRLPIGVLPQLTASQKLASFCRHPAPAPVPAQAQAQTQTGTSPFSDSRSRGSLRDLWDFGYFVQLHIIPSPLPMLARLLLLLRLLLGFFCFFFSCSRFRMLCRMAASQSAMPDSHTSIRAMPWRKSL